MTLGSIDSLLVSIDQAFDHTSWHGPNLMGSLRGVGARQAAWRPAPGRHSIWQLAVHAAYWKYRVYRWLDEAPPRSFDKKGSNFFDAPEPDTAEQGDWDQDLALLRAWHARLRAAVAGFDAERLDDTARRSQRTFRDLILGVAAHDVYHAGQIQLLKRLRKG